MTVVAFDTSSIVLSVSLAWRDEKRGPQSIHKVLDIGLYHGEFLAQTVSELLSSAGKSMEHVDLVACTEGPGSFTGLRIGMATAKGFAAAGGIPFRAVPTLDVWADVYSWWPGVCVPVIDAKKQRFYGAVYAGGRRISPDLDAAPEVILQHARSLGGADSVSEAEQGAAQAASLPLLVTGPDAERFGNACEPESWAPLGFAEPLCTQAAHTFTSAALARLAEQRFQEHGPSQTSSGPRYVRKSDAEIGRELRGD